MNYFGGSAQFCQGDMAGKIRENGAKTVISLVMQTGNCAIVD